MIQRQAILEEAYFVGSVDFVVRCHHHLLDPNHTLRVIDHAMHMLLHIYIASRRLGALRKMLSTLYSS